ncbi:MAG: PEP-CTERM sorting domain-containing protein [Microcystaceae cyanobacterium]
MINKSTLTALTLFGVSASTLLVGNSAQAALFFNATDDGVNTTVTLTGIDFTTSGLTPTGQTARVSTFIRPDLGRITYTGATDTATDVDTAFSIPTFSFGTGGIQSAASNLSSSNPFIYLRGDSGEIFSVASSPIPSDFIATATYSGTLADLEIDTTPQTFTWDNGQEFRLFQEVPSATTPEPSAILGLIGVGLLGLVTRKRK